MSGEFFTCQRVYNTNTLYLSFCTLRKKNAKTAPWFESFFSKDYLTVDIHADTEGEVEFIRSILALKRGVRLLDAACGYGRHLVPLIERGVDAVGCDLSADLLAEASMRLSSAGVASGRRLVRADNRYLPFEEVFDAACLMYTSFGYFDAEDENFKVLASLAGALKSGGRLLIETVNRDYYIRMTTPKDWFEKDGAFILEQKTFDPVRNRSEIDVTVIDSAGKRTYHHSIRLYSFTELSMFLEAAGFEVEEVRGGFFGEEYGIESNRMIVLARAQ